MMKAHVRTTPIAVGPLSTICCQGLNNGIARNGSQIRGGLRFSSSFVLRAPNSDRCVTATPMQALLRSARPCKGRFFLRAGSSAPWQARRPQSNAAVTTPCATSATSTSLQTKHHYSTMDDVQQRQQTARFHTFEARMKAEEGKWTEAIGHYTKAIEAVASDPVPLIERSEAFMAVEDFDGCISDAQRALKLLRGPSEAEQRATCHVQIGLAYLAMERYESARDAFQASIKEHNDPEVEALYKRASIMAHMKFVPRSVPAPENDPQYYKKLTEEHKISIRSSKDPQSKESRGRGVFADKNFEEGEILFVEEPIVSLADSAHQKSGHCEHCLRPLVGVEMIANDDLSKQIKERLSPEVMDEITNKLGADLPPIHETNCVKQCGAVYCSTECRDSARTLHHENSPLCDPSLADSNALSEFIDAYPHQESHGGKELTMMMIKLLNKLILKYRQNNTKPTSLLDEDLERLTYMAYVSESPLVIPEHEKERYQLINKLFPSLKDQLTEKNYMRLLSIIQLNTMTVELHQLGVKIVGGVIERPVQPSAHHEHGPGCEHHHNHDHYDDHNASCEHHGHHHGHGHECDHHHGPSCEHHHNHIHLHEHCHHGHGPGCEHHHHSNDHDASCEHHIHDHNHDHGCTHHHHEHGEDCAHHHHHHHDGPSSDEVVIDEDADTGVSLEPCVNEMATIRGSALYRIASYLNHSCDPNVAALYPHLGGHVTAFVASKPIKKDDELFYRYDSTTENLHERRKKLHKNYHFWCNCSRCQAELAKTWSSVH